MTQIVAINDNTNQGKLLIELLRTLKKSSSILFLSEAELEKMEDKVFGKMIEEGSTGEFVDTDKFLKKLKRK